MALLDAKLLPLKFIPDSHMSDDKFALLFIGF
jgi:hypothetical protein